MAINWFEKRLKVDADLQRQSLDSRKRSQRTQKEGLVGWGAVA
jgi:hypothetical protein